MGECEALSEVEILFCGEEFGRGFQYTKEACDRITGVKVKRCPRREVEAHIASAEILVPLMTRLSREILSKAAKARLVIQYGVGLEGVDIPAATELGIWVSNIPSNATGNALSCAEMVIFLILSCLRRAHEMEASIQARSLGLPIGEALFSKTCLIIGFGNIARELTPRLKAFGVQLLAVRQTAWENSPPAGPEQLLDLRAPWSQLLECAARADIVVLACTETAATHGIIGTQFLESCKQGVIIINVTRGGLLDYGAVKQGLQSGRVGALGLDVHWQEPFDPEDEIAQHPRVHLTPHVAGVTELSYRGMAEIVAQEARRLQEGHLPTVQINEVTQQRTPQNGL